MAVSADRIVVMGVSGAGKTTLGRALATSLGWRFLDADDFHSDEAKAIMRAGGTLTEEQRAPWLARVRPVFHGSGGPAVLACSALRDTHRKTLEPHTLVHITINPALALERLAGRRGHFAGPSIAASQFATLEPPDNAIVVDASWPTVEQLRFVLSALAVRPVS